MTLPILKDAYPEDGQLKYEKVVAVERGVEKTHTVNVSKLFNAGVRKTGDVGLLIREARQAADGVEIDNPAFPASERVADVALDKLSSKDLDPAWTQFAPSSRCYDVD